MQYIAITEVGIIVMILLAGLLGGTINYLLEMEKDVDVNNSDKDHKTKSKRGSNFITWRRCVVIAIGASFLVPLFLATISSDLIKSLLDPVRSASTSTDAFVFFGFCLIGAISSRLFIQTLSDRVLMEAKQAKKEAERAKTEVRDLKSVAEPVLQQQTEPDDSTSDQLTARTPADLTDAGRAILGALNNSKYVLRTRTGISRQCELDIATVTEELNILVNNALVSRIERNKGERWAITASGQRLIEEWNSRK